MCADGASAGSSGRIHGAVGAAFKVCGFFTEPSCFYPATALGGTGRRSAPFRRSSASRKECSRLSTETGGAGGSIVDRRKGG